MVYLWNKLINLICTYMIVNLDHSLMFCKYFTGSLYSTHLVKYQVWTTYIAHRLLTLKHQSFEISKRSVLIKCMDAKVYRHHRVVGKNPDSSH